MTSKSHSISIVLPQAFRPRERGDWLINRLQHLSSSALGQEASFVQFQRGLEFFGSSGERLAHLPTTTAKSTLFLSPAYLLLESPAFSHLAHLAETDRPVFYEEAGSGLILAAALPVNSRRQLVADWVQYLGHASTGKPAPRPPCPDQAWVLREDGIVSDWGFDRFANPLDDFRRSRNMPAVNQLLAELSRIQGSGSPSIEELAVLRSSSSVPWLINTLLNLVEYRLGAYDLRSIPQEVHVSTTSACNIECRFCSYTHKDASFTYLDLDRFRNLGLWGWLENVRLSSGLGEPSLNPHLGSILEYLGHNHPQLNINLFTNGLAWGKPGFLDGILRASWINVSLNASTAGTWKELCLKDGFSKVLDNLTKLRRRKSELRRHMPRVHGSTVLNANNISELPDLPALCVAHGVARLTAIPFFALGYTSPEKYGGAHGLEASREAYEAVYEQTVLAAEKACVSIELPMPLNRRRIGFGLEVRGYFDFGHLERQQLFIDRLLPALAEAGSQDPCPSVWRLSAIAAASKGHANQQDSHFLYPCLGPLSSRDFSTELPIRFNSRQDFLTAWNSPVYQRLRRGQHEPGLSPTCDLCRQKDSRDPANFDVFIDQIQKSKPELHQISNG